MKLKVKQLRRLIRESTFDRVKINAVSIVSVQLHALEALKSKLCEISGAKIGNHVSLYHLWRNTAPGVSLGAYWITNKHELVLAVTCIDENHMMSNGDGYKIYVSYVDGFPNVEVYSETGSSAYQIKRTKDGVRLNNRSVNSRVAKPLFDDLVNHVEEWAQPRDKGDGSWWADKETYELIRPLFAGEENSFPPEKTMVAYDPTTGDELS